MAKSSNQSVTFWSPIRVFHKAYNFDFMSRRKIAFILSFCITLCSLAGLATIGLQLSIDFTGGVLIETAYNGMIDVNGLQKSISKELGQSKISTYKSNGNHLLIQISSPEIKMQSEVDRSAIEQSVLKVLGEQHEVIRLEYVGPKVGKHFMLQVSQAITIALVAMATYTLLRFKWQFAVGVVIALIHDAIAMLGFYVFSGFQFDLTSIAAILTVIGYSINDSVVIYDRIRENLRVPSGLDLRSIINNSINETLSRSIMTTGTTLVVCLALLIYGGETLRSFSAATTFGVAFGTYSSIYISAPILIFTRLNGRLDRQSSTTV